MRRRGSAWTGLWFVWMAAWNNMEMSIRVDFPITVVFPHPTLVINCLCRSITCGMTRWKEPSCNDVPLSVTYLGIIHSDLRSPDPFPPLSLKYLGWPSRHRPRERRGSRGSALVGPKGRNIRPDHVLLSLIRDSVFSTLFPTPGDGIAFKEEPATALHSTKRQWIELVIMA